MKQTRPAITPAQAAARRANGKLSHGPVTDAGKAASSQNAMKFGFFALNPLLPGESAEEFARFRASLVESYQPVGGAEVMLVDRLVESGWRLRRFPSVEAALYASQLLEEQAGLVHAAARRLLAHRVQLRASDAAEPEKCQALFDQESEIRAELNSPEYALGRIFRRDGRRDARRGARSGEAFTRLARCEMLVERGFYRCLRELRELQQARAAAEAAAKATREKAAAKEEEAVERNRRRGAQNEPTNSPIPLDSNELGAKELHGNQFPNGWEQEHLARQALYRTKIQPKR